MATQRIHLWSGPRNVSTALMYSFAQRPDTRVVDEPLYAQYLRVSGALHPVFVVEQRAGGNISPVVHLEVYGRVEAAPKHVVEKPVPPEIPDDEPFEGTPS